MKKENEEMLEALRAFVIKTAERGERAAPAALEAMTEAAWIVLDNS